jgi:exonuclease SbcC
MRLDSLWLKNFCHHRDLKLDFEIGVNGIIGPNGSGKSTIAQGLQFAALGESGNPGAKIDDLNWDAAAAGEGGSVECKFEKNGEPGTLKRVIQRASASLAWGSVKERSVSGVNAEVLKLMGVSEKTLKDIVFVMQGRIERVLFDRPADRKKNFHALFGIDKAEDIRELLRKELSSLGVEPSDDRIEQLQKRLADEIDPQLKTLVARSKELASSVEGVSRDEYQSIVTRHNEVSQLQADVARVTAELNQLTLSIAKLVQEKDDLKRLYDTSASDLAARKTNVDKLRERIAGADAAKKLHDAYEQMKADKQAAEAMAAAPNPTPPGTDQAAIDAADQQLIEARAELAPKQAFVKAFENSAGTVTVTCPTCLQLVERPAEKAAQMRAELADQAAKISNVEQALVKARQELRDYERAYQHHRAQVTTAERTIAEINIKLANIITDDYTPDLAEAAELSRRTVSDYEAAVKEHDACGQRLQLVSQGLAGKEGQTQPLQQQLAALQAKIEQAPTEEDYLFASDVIQRYDAASQTLAHVNGQIQQLQHHRATTLTELEQLQKKAEGAEAAKKYQELCERARTLFHHDCLPQVATQQYLAGLNAHLNKYLQTFEVPFGCNISEDLSVMCTRPGVGEKPAERLSGGQKVMLGIAFRFAIYDMFAADLGFMVLDEPTNMLDEDHVSCVAEIMEAVRRHAHNTGMQLIVITHERELMNTFDHTIQL